jgi:Cu/Ag efflux protein CusF
MDRTKVPRCHVAMIVVSLVAGGCASYQLAPLSISHPANPEAPTAPARPSSQTLAYTASDIPPIRPVSPVAAALHGEHGPRSADVAKSRTVVGEGEVIATMPKAGQIVLEHAEIAGFMEAMTMGYRIDPPSLLEGLAQGNRIRFTIDVDRRAIIAIEKLR